MGNDVFWRTDVVSLDVARIAVGRWPGSGENLFGDSIDAEPIACKRRSGLVLHANAHGSLFDRLERRRTRGSAVPQDVQLQSLPQISAALGRYKADQYIIVGNQLVGVEPNACRVVAIVPDMG